MSKWKCGICNNEFDNFQAQGFGGTIYCPLCYFKELYRRTKIERDRLNKEYERIYNENCKLRENHNINDITLLDENERLNNIINELENTIENFMENHTEGYIDWKYDREIYLAESNVLQKLYDTYFEKLQELKEE